MPDSDSERSELLADRIFSSALGALELYSIYLGGELGLYRALADHGSMTFAQLSRAANISPRYAREWLEQQAVAGILAVDGATCGSDGRRYRLDKAHAQVLAESDGPLYAVPMAQMVAGVGGVMDQLLQAYQKGTGVSYEAYGRAFREGQGRSNRSIFAHELITVWLDSLPEVVQRMKNADRVRIADIGCGQGWSTLTVAEAFENARVDGYDTDAASLGDARGNLAGTGLDGRVRFFQESAVEIGRRGPYDLVLMLETLHDLSRPLEALRAVRLALAEGGVVLIAEERVADSFFAPGDESERMAYGWSVTHCLPSQMVDRASAATGSVLRARKVHRLAAQAGFATCVDLPGDNTSFKLYLFG